MNKRVESGSESTSRWTTHGVGKQERRVLERNDVAARPKGVFETGLGLGKVFDKGLPDLGGGP